MLPQTIFMRNVPCEFSTDHISTVDHISIGFLETCSTYLQWSFLSTTCKSRDISLTCASKVESPFLNTWDLFYVICLQLKHTFQCTWNKYDAYMTLLLDSCWLCIHVDFKCIYLIYTIRIFLLVDDAFYVCQSLVLLTIVLYTFA